MFTVAAQDIAARRPLIVGDRLDTDIEGAVRAGMDSLLVLTGVNTVEDALRAEPVRRPTFILPDLAQLAAPFALPVVDGRSEEHTSELQSRGHLVCRLLLEKNNVKIMRTGERKRYGVPVAGIA